jgi:hypothetical protein
MWQLKFMNMRHSISLSLSQQKSDDMNILRSDFWSISRNMNFGFSTMINNNWTIAPRISLNTFDMGNRIYRATQNYSLMLMNRTLKSKLSSSFTFSFMNSSNIQSMIFSLQSGYRISKSDMIKINLRSSMYIGKLETIRDFKEYRGTINYVHNF